MSPQAARRGALLGAAALLLLVVVPWLTAAWRRTPPNILLISIDTLRSDHLGCYGYPRPTTPAIDGFRRDAIMARMALANAPSTLPSHASLMTSLIPQHHGASHTHRIPLSREALTLAEVLQEQGYETLAVVGSGQLVRQYGLAQGFEVYDEIPEDRPFADTVARGLELLLRRPSARPFFLFLHTYEVHHPYTPTREHLVALDPKYAHGELPSYSPERLWEMSEEKDVFSPAELQPVIDAYDGEIHSMDQAFAGLVSSLRRLGLYDRLLVVFTSDHGEEFGEHGFVGWHSHTLYDELLRVPLLIKLPGQRQHGRTLQPIVSLIDVAPTILAQAGIEAPADFEGHDVLPLLNAPLTATPAVVFARERMPFETGRFWGLRLGHWKLEEGRLHDLGRDPLERVDLAAQRPNVMADLQRLLYSTVRARRPLRAEEVSLDAETLSRLRALGYAN